MSVSNVDRRVLVHAAPVDLRTSIQRTDDGDAIMSAAAERTVIRFAGDAADLVLAALFGEVDHTPKPRDNAARWPRTGVEV